MQILWLKRDFFKECTVELRRDFHARGQRLIVRTGDGWAFRRDGMIAASCVAMGIIGHDVRSLSKERRSPA